ncbi:MAG: DUF465 domain-containing protein [Chromatiales bacterium]|nr:DUF465 domain-containing protein [Chromatiales bacterium]
MLGENHDLIHEFPEYESKIRELVANDSQFADLMKRYDALDARVRELEEQAQPVADETMEDLKKERLMLKDELYTMLRQ